MRNYVVDLVLEADSRDVTPVPLVSWGKGYHVRVGRYGRVVVTARQRADGAPEAIGVAVAQIRGRWPGGEHRPLRLVHARAQRRWLGRAGAMITMDGDGGAGEAGVREPRRPKPSPGHLYVSASLPEA